MPALMALSRGIDAFERGPSAKLQTGWLQRGPPHQRRQCRDPLQPEQQLGDRLARSAMVSPCGHGDAGGELYPCSATSMSVWTCSTATTVPRTRLYVDIFGMTFFLLPTTILLTWMTWPFFVTSWLSDEGSSNAGGLLRWPVKLILPIGLSAAHASGLFPKSSSASRCCAAWIRKPKSSPNINGRNNDQFSRLPTSRKIGADADSGPYATAHVRRHRCVPADRLPGRVLACRGGLVVWLPRRSRWASFRTAYLGNLPLRVFGILSNDLLLAIPFFTLMGAILERMQIGGRSAGGDRPAVRRRVRAASPMRSSSWAPFSAPSPAPLPRRSIAMGDDLAADHDALRLRHAHRDRRDRRLGHDHAGDPALARSDRPGRPARQLCRRDVCRRARARRSFRFCCFCAFITVVALDRAASTCRRCRQAARHSGLAAAAARSLGHGAVGGPDLPRARHDLHGASPPPTEAGAMGAVGAAILAVLNGRLTFSADQ